MGCAASISHEVNRDSFIYSITLGVGGFSKVSSAMHIESGKWVAMKEISITRNHTAWKNNLNVANNELNVLMSLGRHPYITSLHFAFSDYRKCFLALDLCTGGDLRYHLREKNYLSERAVAFIVACVAQALHHMHKRGIIHRDIKPENIILDEYGFPRVTDFGISYIATDDDEGGISCYLASGTRQYISPEVFIKNHAHGVEADFWSLGITTYELLFQRRPFEKHCPLEFIAYAQEAYLKGGHTSVTQPPSQRLSEYDINTKSLNLHPTSPMSATVGAHSPGGIFHGACSPSYGSCSPHLDADHPPNFNPTFRENVEVDPLCGPPSINSEYMDSYGISPPSGMGSLNSSRLQVRVPWLSRSIGEVSASCASVLSGLLDLRLWMRLGAGENYAALKTHPWFEENSLSWCLIEMQRVPPPFVPDKVNVNEDAVKRHEEMVCTTNGESCALPVPQDEEQQLRNFYFVSQEFEKREPLRNKSSRDTALSQENMSSHSFPVSISMVAYN